MQDDPLTLASAAFESLEGEPVPPDLLEINPARHLELGSHLAEGGMGRVHNVEDTLLERSHVVKFLHPRLRDQPAVVRSFLTEARLTASLEHPAIVPVYTLGSRPDTGPFFTMKRVEGRTLMKRLSGNPHRPLPRDELLDIIDVIIKVCDALSMAHSRGVLHLDLKPSNIMIGDHGQVYLLDWGMAHRISDGEEGPPAVRGTPGLMAPEQARGEPVDQRADVFGLGAVLFFVLARRGPFWRRDPNRSLEAAKRGERPSLAKVASKAPPGLVALTERALATDRDARTSTVAELQAELRAFIRGDQALPRSSFPAGHVLLRQGHPGGSAWIIHAGRCAVYQADGSTTRLIREMGAGESFGELSLLTGAPVSASVTTSTACELIEVTAETFERELDEMSPWMRSLVRLLAERFQSQERRDRG
jgi:eukaryotic-like serine/threonine-protein kinase